MSELDLHKFVVHFAQSNKAEGKSPVTVTWYSEMLDDFVGFLESAMCNKGCFITPILTYRLILQQHR